MIIYIVTVVVLPTDHFKKLKSSDQNTLSFVNVYTILYEMFVTQFYRSLQDIYCI